MSCILFWLWPFQKLEFTVGPKEPKSPVAKPIPMKNVQRELSCLLVQGNATNKAVFDWIDVSWVWCPQPGKNPLPENCGENHLACVSEGLNFGWVDMYREQYSPNSQQANVHEPRTKGAPFIRALMTTVCKSAILGQCWHLVNEKKKPLTEVLYKSKELRSFT